MKTVVIGASTNPSRYAYIASKMLHENNLEFVPVGIKSGVVFGKEILDLKSKSKIDDVHTITLYLEPQNQKEWYDYILSLKPKRIIFNPGTENPELVELAHNSGIETEMACTLVLISTNSYSE